MAERVRNEPPHALIELARIFQMPVEELMGMAKAAGPKRRLSAVGIRHAERYAQLNKMQQRFVGRIIRRAEVGNLGDVKSVGGGVGEMRID